MGNTQNKTEAFQGIHDIQNAEVVVKNAMLAGYRACLLLNGLEKEFYELLATGDSSAQINEVFSRFLGYEKEEHKKAVDNAQYLFDGLKKKGGSEYSDALKSIFGILTNVQNFTKEGCACDASGNQAEDNVFNAIAGTTIEEYKTLQYYDRTTGNTGDDPAIGGERIRVMFTKTPEGASATITQYNEPMLAAGVIKAVENNRELIHKLLASVGIDPVTGKDSGTASIVRSTVIEVAKGMGIVEYAEGTKLIKAAAAGNIQNFRHVIIGAMETLSKMKDDVLNQASEEDVNRYLNWINVFSVIPTTQQEQIISDADINSYVDDAGKNLSGADDSGAIITGASITTAQRRKYLKVLGKMVAGKLHSAFVQNSSTIHPKTKEILALYSSTYLI